MPTTQDEARRIITICRKYLSAPCLISMAVELDEQVGSRTENESLRVTLAMLRQGSESLCASTTGTDGQAVEGVLHSIEQQHVRADPAHPLTPPRARLWQPPGDPPAGAVIWCLLWLVLVIGHFVLLGCMAAAALILPWGSAPWYVALPAIVYIVNLLFTRDPCPLTLLENFFRGRMGWALLSGGFVGHYLVKPVRKWWTPRSPSELS